jgi:hypothetical protein
MNVGGWATEELIPMRNSIILVLASVAIAGTAVPASAAWDRLGTIQVSPGRDQDRVYRSFGGPIERLQLDADYSDVHCRSVRVTFANGRQRNVFTGRLNDRVPRIVDLPGEQRNVRRIDFRCRSLDRRTAQIQIAADIGQYRETWRRSPDWDRLWARLFPWANDRPAASDRDWVRLGSERFEGRRDRETVFAGFGGRRLSAIGVQPVDDDARCSSIRVRFANGRTREISTDWGDRLSEDRIYRFDLPGTERNVQRVQMVCRPIGDRDVTLNIYGLT